MGDVQYYRSQAQFWADMAELARRPDYRNDGYGSRSNGGNLLSEHNEPPLSRPPPLRTVPAREARTGAEQDRRRKAHQLASLRHHGRGGAGGGA
jgi:hypothetical protein